MEFTSSMERRRQGMGDGSEVLRVDGGGLGRGREGVAEERPGRDPAALADRVVGDRSGGNGEGPMRRAPGGMNIQLKVGMLGDSAVGKTSLMVKYVENKFDEDYIHTLGINFMEKVISLRDRQVTFTIFDLGGESEFHSMIPLVCADSSAILFMFDLTRRATLQSIKEWYRQARGYNQTFIPFLVGTKFDLFNEFSVEKQKETVSHARRFAKAMKAPLAFTSASHSINIQKLFKIVLSKRFNLTSNVPTISNIGEPILEYNN